MVGLTHRPLPAVGLTDNDGTLGVLQGRVILRWEPRRRRLLTAVIVGTPPCSRCGRQGLCDTGSGARSVRLRSVRSGPIDDVRRNFVPWPEERAPHAVR